MGFWRGAGQPFATIVAGLAALTAGALALHNGEHSASPDAAALEKAFNIKTIRQLGSNKFFAVAAPLVDARRSRVSREGVVTYEATAGSPRADFWSNGTTTLASGEFFASWYADSRVAGTASRSRYTPISCSRTLIRC